ncbi:hypothetical protein FACS189474_6020 [Bacteroidia bacterium]|nr:hypothetical protein FACS189474_6020 [Bacteroidia bacterium]
MCKELEKFELSNGKNYSFTRIYPGEVANKPQENYKGITLRAFNAVCDSSSLLQDAFRKLTKVQVYSDYKKMIEEAKPECLFVATPTKFHAEMVIYAMERGIHVFCEKPFSLKLAEGQKMTDLAQEKKLVNHAEPGFITMNMCKMVDVCESIGIKNPIIC